MMVKLGRTQRSRVEKTIVIVKSVQNSRLLVRSVLSVKRELCLNAKTI